MNGAQFARNMEQAYRDIWRVWVRHIGIARRVPISGLMADQLVKGVDDLLDRLLPISDS